MEPRKRRISPTPIAALVGFSSLAAGLAGWDWRLSATTCGALLLIFAVLDALRPRRNP